MISYSLSFGVRARCKFCTSGPKYFSCVLAGNTSKDVLDELEKSINFQVRKVNPRAGIAAVNYLFFPNRENKLSYCSMNVAYASVNVKNYRSLRPKREAGKLIFRSSYSCECLKTTWVTRDFLLIEANHISQRLSFKGYTKDIIMV